MAMDKNQALDKIVHWILQAHDHHNEDEHGHSMCLEGEYPYVNSIELEKFVKSLKDKEK